MKARRLILMGITYTKEAVAAIWVLVLCGVGFVAGLTSISSWAGLGFLAVVGLVVLQRLWRNPAQTLSESIGEARR
jgi:hypothetical protein